MDSQLTRIIAVRHGETDWNVATRIQGQLDIAPNDAGRWQAQRLARALAGEALDAIYTSDPRAPTTPRAPSRSKRGSRHVPILACASAFGVLKD